MDSVFLYDFIKIISFLHQHFRENVGTKDCAELVGYSEWYLGRTFKKYMGESIADYVRSLRLNEAKKELRSGKKVKDVAKSLSYASSESFHHVFMKQYGISPIQYAAGETPCGKYDEEYDYYITPEDWKKGINPYSDVWEYAYFDPKEKRYERMTFDGSDFIAPFSEETAADPYWYCRNRTKGYGIHPGREIQAVRTFRCPKDGIVDVLFIVGKIAKLKRDFTPVGAQLVHNETPLVPSSSMMVIKDVSPTCFAASCEVKAGDRISLHVDAMGDAQCSGLHLYRQWVRYRNPEWDLSKK